jgi:hypothetical protein
MNFHRNIYIFVVRVNDYSQNLAVIYFTMNTEWEIIQKIAMNWKIEKSC